MKTYIKTILTLTILVFCEVSAQVTDTLAYVKSFEANKLNYIGQPFSKLLNDMTQLQPKTVWTHYRDSGFKFCNKDESFDIGTVNMMIFWQTPIPFSESEYYEQKNHFYFTNDERNFYGSKIIKDIYVRVTQ